MRIRYNYKNYPLSKELTQKSLQLSKMTHPLSALVWGAIPGIILIMVFPSSFSMIVMLAGMVAGPILAPRIRKKKSAKLDEEYAKLLQNRQQ